jgi:branched-chain amino acid transport system substrate-binding protein
VAAIGSGCAGSGSGIQPGERVTVYVSAPLRGVQGSEGRDVADGARLALADGRASIGALGVRAVYLDDTAGRGSRARWSAATAAANARRAAEDSTAIAFVGDLASGATRFSLPITNEARMLQVSPASSAIDLAQPYLGAGDQVPRETQPTGERTFGRVIPSDEAQARAGAAWAKRLGARAAIVASDRSRFGRTMGAAFSAEARALGIDAGGGRRFPDPFAAPRRPRPDAPVACRAILITTPLIYSAGLRPPAALAGPCADSWRLGLGVLGSDALLRPGPLAVLGSIRPPVRLTSAAQDPAQLPAEGQRFARRFQARYGRPPGRYAAYGYEAMAAVLDSIRRAGASGAEREAVVEAFFETRDRRSVLGPYSIDEVGDTTLDRMSGYRVARGGLKAVARLEVP